MRARVVAAVVAAGVFAAAAAAYTPSDPQANHPAYAALNLPEAWEVTTGSPNVVVAVVDSGIDPHMQTSPERSSRGTTS